MRWKGQEVDAERASRLPGLADGPITRTFDAPEAVGISFTEVHARSALNEVPPMAYVDFRYTVNPYRGCTHACSYCLDGATQILGDDLTTRPLADLSVGDRIIGVERRGRYLRYVPTRVRDHWRTFKPAYRIVLSDGSDIIASGDHRFLSRRGWKYVTGAEQGRDRRPHLTVGTKLVGLGSHSVAPGGAFESEDYRTGYLCGMIRGDGTFGTYTYRRGGREATVHRFRLALADRNALLRSRRYLKLAGVPTRESEFSEASECHRPVWAIRTSQRGTVDRVRELSAIRERPSIAWGRGYLAGIFDAEGSSGNGTIRILGVTDLELLDEASRVMADFGFHTTRDLYGRAASVRLRGGLPEAVRFFGAIRPAIDRKRPLEGRAVKGPHTVVEAIEPVGPRELWDITTGTGNFVANGIVSHNCFARPTHRYLELNPREDFDRKIVVKVNLPEVLRAELRRPSWKREHVALGTNTDPYQWVESRYRITRGVWEELLEVRNPCSVLTKSPLLVRDLDLFKQLDAKTDFAANLSIPTLERKAWRQTEPGTPNPEKRIEAIAELSAAGIRTGVLIAPLMPGINDSPRQVERLLERCGEAGADSINGLGLHLRGELREIFFDWLRQYRPELLERYERLYPKGRGNLPPAERRRLARMVNRGRRRPRHPAAGDESPIGSAVESADAEPAGSSSDRGGGEAMSLF